MGSPVTTVLLDTHVVHWWSAEPDRISRAASAAIDDADELAVSAITWFELAWLAKHERIVVTIPVRTWLQQLSGQVRTIGITPAIADAAASLPSSFPGDPADRLIYATAVEHGWRLVTKDRDLRAHRHPRPVAIW
jgi:PIN domain nuclease of toxin-antitoxin system